MQQLAENRFVLKALWELLAYDLRHTLFGFGSIYAGVSKMAVAACPMGPDTQRDVTRGVELALSLYVKRVHCLQKSVVIVRILRGQGIPAELVIGVKTDPLLCHAWVEVQGAVVLDSPVFRQTLTILDRVRLPEKQLSNATSQK